MERNTYVMKDEEIQTLIAGLLTHGPEEFYVKIRAKAIFSMETKDNIDEMFLDMSEYFLKKGREEIKMVKDDDASLATIYYTLSLFLRKVAHEVYRKYIWGGKDRDSKRFLRLVSSNNEVPLMV